MAKKQQPNLNLFSATEPTAAAAGDSDLDAGNIRPLGIGLRQGEIEALQTIADTIGVKRNALTRWLIRWAIEEYRAGRVDPNQYSEEPEPTKKLKMP